MDAVQLEVFGRSLVEFITAVTDDQSLYGRKMDRALAKDLLRALPAYGLPWDIYNGLRDNIRDWE